MLAVAATLGAAPAASQSPDSLVAQLGATDWQRRGDAIARLNLLPVEALPPTFAPTAIALLEREATNPDPGPREGEGYGEYLIAVMSGVVRLQDPRSLRGLALLGIQMSRGAQEYVASQGAPSLPFLDEAWARSQSDAVATTWAYMLGRYATALSRPERLQVIARLVAVLPDNSRAFTWAAVMGPLPEAVPLVEMVATGDARPETRQAGIRALASLRPVRDRLSSREVLQRVSDWLDAFCWSATGARGDACKMLSVSLTNATSQVESRGLTGTRLALEDLVRQARTARAAGGLRDIEEHFIVGNAEYLSTRPQ